LAQFIWQRLFGKAFLAKVNWQSLFGTRAICYVTFFFYSSFYEASRVVVVKSMM
jgi:hypothetical protein